MKKTIAFTSTLCLAAAMAFSGCKNDDSNGDGDGDGDGDTGGTAGDGDGDTGGGTGDGDGDTGGSSSGGMGGGGGQGGGTSVTGDFSFSISGFTFHAGKYFEYKLLDSDGAEVDTDSGTVSGGGDLAFDSTEVTMSDETYRLVFFAEIDSNETCDITDHIWELTDLMPDANGDLEVEFEHTAVGLLNDCSDFE